MSHTADLLQPTIIYEPAAEPSKASSSEVSQSPVGLVAGTAPRFSDETAALIRRRLKAASLLLAILLSGALVRNMLVFGLIAAVDLQAVCLLSLFAVYFVLRSGRTLSLMQLRLIELLVFGEFFLAVEGAEWFELQRSVGDGDFKIAVVIRFFAMFSMLILAYGMLMPNTWQRAAAILFPVACIPFAVILSTSSQGMALALSFEPFPFMAAFLAVFGTHVINASRKAAFKARQFGQYRLKEKLGAGGMGEVYRAEHMLLKRPCVIKLIKQDRSTNAAALARFEREVRSTAKLTHSNSVEIFDYGHTEDGVFYYVMEYLPGKSLDDLVNEYGPMPPERIVHFLRQTCGALREAHHLGLIHRDLKPANIFAAKLGGVHDVTKLLDFGLVRQADSDQQLGVNLTRSDGFSGSPLYMPPEQATSYDEVDDRGDIYSLGAVAYFLVTGAPPFSGRNATEVIMAHAHEQVTPPSKIVSTIPSDLERIILRCLEKKPQNRFQDVESLEEALAACEYADEWTEKKAAQWWDNFGERLEH
jgi:serine/threonine-protein kinase